jgi:hypothetical protein
MTRRSWQIRIVVPRAGGALVKCKGVDGTVEFDGDFVIIKRRLTGKDDNRIPIGRITAIQWKPRGRFARGSISFTVPEGLESKSRFGMRNAGAGKDENSVVVAKSHEPEFLELKRAVEDKMPALHASASAPSPSETSSLEAPDDPAARLRQLTDLHDAGLLTDHEFATKRAAIIDRL